MAHSCLRLAVTRELTSSGTRVDGDGECDDGRRDRPRAPDESRRREHRSRPRRRGSPLGSAARPTAVISAGCSTARCASGCGPGSRTSQTIAIFPTSTRSSPGTRSTRTTAAHSWPRRVGLRWTGSRATSRRRPAGRWHISRAILARLGDGERALDCLEMVARHCLRDNLLTVINDWRGQGVTMFWGHGESPPTNIDANCGITAAVLEMLCYSRPGFVAVLPGLPRAWSRGSARGIRCRGGVTVISTGTLPRMPRLYGWRRPKSRPVSLCLPEYLRAEWQGVDGLAG